MRRRFDASEAVTPRSSGAAAFVYSTRREVCPVCQADIPPCTPHSCSTFQR
jgi:hypothetical protein